MFSSSNNQPKLETFAFSYNLFIRHLKKVKNWLDIIEPISFKKTPSNTVKNTHF